MSLDMLFKVLWALEGFPTKFASMWFEWYVDADVGSDVISLHDRNMTVAPSTLQI